MANENKEEKRSRGRPSGREFTHMARIPMKPEQWERLSQAAQEENRPVAAIVRDLIEKYLRRRGRGGG